MAVSAGALGMNLCERAQSRDNNTRKYPFLAHFQIDWLIDGSI